MMEGWEQVKLSKIAKIFSGYAFKGKEMTTILDEGIPLVKIKNVFDRKVSINFDSYLKNDYFLNKYSKYELLKGDVLVAMTGQGSVGRIGKMHKISEKVLVNQRVGIVRIDNDAADKEFVYQQMATLHNESVYFNLAMGAGQPNLSPKDIGNLKINLPPLKTQRKIASILSAYDDLIENNLKRIKLLEEQAQQTYEEWFVRFKFPGHEEVEIDEMSGLPVGWEKDRLDKLLFLQRGFDLPTRSREIGKIPIFASTGIVDYHNEMKVKGPGIITGRSGTLGQVQYSFGDFWPLNTSLWVKKYFNCGPIFVLHFLRALNLQRFGGGSAVPSLDRKVVHSQYILIPDKIIINNYEKIVSPLFMSKKNLQNQNQLLKEARDLLLPRLMNGMIDVDKLELGDLDQQVKESSLGMVAEERVKYK